MKLTFSDPVVVSMGPETKKAIWGPYQFPEILKLPNGALLYNFNMGEDSEKAYGRAPRGGCFISYNGGKDWTAAVRSSLADIEGIRLPSGDFLMGGPWGSVPLEGLELPEPVGTTHLDNTIYRIEDVNPAYSPKTWVMQYRKAGSAEWKSEEVKLNWPNMIIRSCLGMLVKPAGRGRMRQAPDGSLWMPHYDFAGINADGSFVPHLCNYLFHSTDEGHTWDLVHYLPYYPDESMRRLPAYEGYGENDIAFAPDGTLVRVIRTGPVAPCWMVRSFDGGKTWTDPEKFDDNGVWPCLLTLGCGVTLATYGRPGIKVRATDDPSCGTWQDPIAFMPARDPKSMEEWGTCGYTSMVALDDRTAALAYTDFRVKDKHGVARKCAMFCTITVES